MEGFIDIHSHIMPMIDDGAKNIDQAINMIKIAYSEGIRTIVATPHYMEGRYELPTFTREAAFHNFKEKVQKVVPQMKFLLGSEIYFSHDIVNLLKEKMIPTIAGTQYVLVEFSETAKYLTIKKALHELLCEGFNPIVAHIERYESLTEDMDLIMELIDLGICTQVNAASVTGELGKTYQNIIKKMLKYDLVQLIATDAHSDGRRAPRLQDCYHYIKKKYSKEYAKELLLDNPKKIISNQYIRE